MSVVDAAGYAMAPSEDFVALTEDFQPEHALRNGHKSVAHMTAKPAAEPSRLALHLEHWALWLRELFGPGGRAPA